MSTLQVSDVVVAFNGLDVAGRTAFLSHMACETGLDSAELTDAYSADDDAFQTDYNVFLRDREDAPFDGLDPVVSTDAPNAAGLSSEQVSTVQTQANPVDPQIAIDAAKREIAKAKAEALCVEIGTRIATGVVSDADRNFAIAGMCFEYHRQRIASVTGKYTQKDFADFNGLIKADVRSRVFIKEKSIRLVDWMIAFGTRELVATHVGFDASRSFSLAEYIECNPHSVTFDKTTLESEFRPTWLDFFKDVARRRASFEHVTSNQFDELVEENAKRAGLVSGTDTTTPEGKTKVENKLKAAEKAKSRKVLTEAINDVVGSGHSTPREVMTEVSKLSETFGKASGLVMFDPTDTTGQHVQAVANALRSANNLNGMMTLERVLKGMLTQIAREQATRNEAKDVLPLAATG